MTAYVVALLLWGLAAAKLGLPWWTVGFAVAAGYLWGCIRFPLTTCPMRCGGRVRDSSGKNWRPCWWCGGRNSRVRWGRRLFENVTGRRKHT